MANRLLDRLRYPRLDAIQIEVTSHCDARCIYCPHTVYRYAWLDRQMSLETFSRLVPAFRKTKLVFLQGWGEPLHHPHLFDMAAAAKAEGCQVGFTTNGALLDDRVAERIVDAQIDVVGFSLAGTDERNDRIRVGNPLSVVLASIERIRQARERRGTDRPALHVAYLLLRSQLGALDGLPELLAGTGVSTAVVSTLDFVPNASLQSEVLAPESPDAYAALRARLDAVRREAQQRGIALVAAIRHPGERRLHCTENVTQSVFVSADGTVSPCVFLNLPIDDARRPVDTELRPRSSTFGSVTERSLASTWRDRRYVRFRAAFQSATPPEPCRSCPKLYLRYD